MDFRKQNCNINFKFISGSITVLRLSELIVKLGWPQETVACELREKNCLPSELSFGCIVHYLHIFLWKKNVQAKSDSVLKKISTNTPFHFWSKCVSQILVWNKWDNIVSLFSFKAFTLIFNGLKIGKVFKSNTWLLILHPVWYLELCPGPEVRRATSGVMYQESSIGFENLAHLQSIKNKCKHYMARFLF